MPRRKNLRLSLELHQLRDDEVRRGWIRIHESVRGGVPAGELVHLQGPAGGVYRVVLGLPSGYLVGDRSANSEWVCMDEPTRNAIGLGSQSLGSKVTIEISQRQQPYRMLAWLLYSLDHPEIPLKVGTWFALVLGIVSVVLGLISVVLGALSLRY